VGNGALEDFCALVAERHGGSALAREAASDWLVHRRVGTARREISLTVFDRISDKRRWRMCASGFGCFGASLQ
jgi:hypothetical protein